MTSLATEILERFLPDRRRVEPTWLRALLLRMAEGEGEVLRLSERRLVMHLPAMPQDGDDWSSPNGFLCKLDAPQRPLEGLRRMLRTPPVEREVQAWQSLQVAADRGQWAGCPFPHRQMAHVQLNAARGLFARPFVQGCPGSALHPRDLPAAGLGLANLHASGWTDPDLSPADLLLDTRSVLLPLDLGHARIAEAPATPDDRRRDLIRILGGWSVPQRRALAEPFLEAYAKAASLPDTAERLIDLALQWRQQILQRQAHRCLRRTSDFEVTPDGMHRTAGVGRDPSVVLEAASPDAARRLWRHLYELELHGLPALRVVRLAKATLHAALPEHGAETVEELLQDLHQAGFQADGDPVRPLRRRGFYLELAAPLSRRGS